MSALTSIVVDSSYHVLRASVRHALPSLSWRHHGIGVLQAYLDEGREPEVRVHVWHPSLVKAGMDLSGDIHDHRFDMTSHVIAGTVIHEEWFATENPEGTHTTMILTHARAAAGSKYHGPTRETGTRYSVASRSYAVPVGHRYTYPSRAFHRSPVASLAVTVVVKRNQHDEPARILHPINIEPIMAFGHDMEYSIVSDVLSQATKAIE